MPTRPKDWCASQFQSAPAIAGGRISISQKLPHYIAMFQSAPAIAGGRIMAGKTRRPATGSFNPRPPLLAGESAPLSASPDTLAVSIRARHCWRANRRRRRKEEERREFQSAPAIAGGRIRLRAVVVALTTEFQSAPAIAGGRIELLQEADESRKLFQSAPAIAGGRIRVDAGEGVADFLVSIRARHCWRANPCCRPPFLRCCLFQSAPAIAGGRINA